MLVAANFQGIFHLVWQIEEE